YPSSSRPPVRTGVRPRMTPPRDHTRPAPRRWLLPAWLALVTGFVALPDPVPGQTTPKDTKAAEKAPKASGLDALKVPPNAVIVLMEAARNALEKIDGVWVPAERYKELLEQAEQLKRLAAARPLVPSECRLSGQVEQRGAQEVARLRAVFKFKTT